MGLAVKSILARRPRCVYLVPGMALRGDSSFRYSPSSTNVVVHAAIWDRTLAKIEAPWIQNCGRWATTLLEIGD